MDLFKFTITRDYTLTYVEPGSPWVRDNGEVWWSYSSVELLHQTATSTLVTNSVEELRKTLALPCTNVTWNKVGGQNYPLPSDLLLSTPKLGEEEILEEILQEFLQKWLAEKLATIPDGDDEYDSALLLEEEPEMVLQYHGLSAYSGARDFLAKAQACLSQDIIICGSDKAIGPVGIIFEGPAYKAWSRDIWSMPEDRNAVSRDQGVSEEHFRDISRKIRGKNRYIETFTQVEWAFGVWCDRDAVPAEVHAEVVAMAAELGLPISYHRPKRMGHFASAEDALDAFFAEENMKEPAKA